MGKLTEKINDMSGTYREYKVKNYPVPQKGFTHAGPFHADDVLSTAFLKLLNPNFEVQRGYVADIPKNYDGIVYDIGFDVGYTEFDHHGEQEYRKNGIPYASFGKLWREFGHYLFDERQCKNFDIGFIQQIDNADCTGVKDGLAMAISAFNPEWDSTLDSNECFDKAVEMAKIILHKQFESIRAKQRAKEIVVDALNNMKNGVVVFDKYLPWTEEAIRNKNALFAVYPSQRGGYNIQVVPRDFNDKTGRISFPEQWLGADRNELDYYVKGMTFCHVSNWLVACDTLETAYKIIDITIQNCREKNPDNEFLPKDFMEDKHSIDR